MKAAVVLGFVVAGCGGAPPSPPASPEPPPPRTRTVPVVDTEPDDGVELVSTRGHFEPRAVEAALAPHTAALTDCFRSQLAGRRWLGGHVALHWDVAATGEITAVKLTESDLGSWPIERCLIEVARQLELGTPTGSAPAEIAIPLDFTATRRPRLWDDDQTLRAVGGQLAKLDACAKAKDVKVVPREVTITVYVGHPGKALSVGFASPASELDDAWATCATEAALGWRLPAPVGAVAKLAIRYR